MYNGILHMACRKQVEMERNLQQQKCEEENDIKQFGHVIRDPTERLRRLYPNQRVYGYKETWNEEIARKEREKKEAEAEELRLKAGRKRKLEILLEEVEWLRRKIAEYDSEEANGDKKSQVS